MSRLSTSAERPDPCGGMSDCEMPSPRNYPKVTPRRPPGLRLHHHIKVFWIGKRHPTAADLNPFLQVRKAKVLAALQYLKHHNHLYGDIAINFSMTDRWSEDFVPSDLQENIIFLDEPDNQEREGYTVNLQHGNYENDLQAAQDETFSIGDDAVFTTGSVSTDINGERQDPNIRMLNTLFDVITERLHPPRTPGTGANDSAILPLPHGSNPPILAYRIHGTATLVDHWTDPCFFTAAFPTLFPTGVGGHLDERDIPVSLSAFAEWALSHHSRRYAPFMRIMRNS
ncbi:hypothetical protein EIK77_001186 [Talaromyces pinophilus]|nr:hypothetical protein EIK77_001186 [Talaromyces pinophilus]